MLRKLLPGLALALWICWVPAAVAAETGTVIWKHQGCAHFIVQTPKDYVLYEWMSGALPNDGEVLEGDFEKTAAVRLQNVTADLPVRAYLIARTGLRRELEAQIPAHCR
jgi:hypothetical protein